MIELLSLTNVSSLAPTSLINSPLTHHLIEHEILHILIKAVRGKGRKKLSRAQMRKLMNRKRRWFVDNIIMHHRRLHEKNRQKSILLAKQGFARKNPLLERKPIRESHKWRDRADTNHDRGLSIRGRIDARRMRARSRWLSVTT